jgi:hypothetical protein
MNMTATPRLKNWRSFLRSLKLESGAHSDPKSGMCLLEAVSYVQGQPFSDAPQCVSPVIAAFGRSWNDSLPDKDRQRLKRFIPAMIETRTTDKDEERRAWLATDWLVRTFTPVWLDKAGLTQHAAKLRALEELTSTALARKAQPIIEDARKDASAARAAARAAAWAAAWDAAGDAARAAARAAAWDAAGAAAWDAAGDAARAAAWAAARAAARAAAWAAARAAASKTKGGYQAKYSAARKAADAVMADTLDETVKELQESAEDLLERMCAVGREAA